MATTDLDRLEALIAEQDKQFRLAFWRFIAAVGQEGAVLDAILERLEARDPEGALKIVDSYVAVFGNVIPKIAATVGSVTATELKELVPDMAIAISFDPSHPRAAELIRAHRAKFVRDISERQRKTIVQALSRAYQLGLGTQETARSFRQAIGLTAGDEGALARYREHLQNRDRRALDGQTRDRRYDAMVERSIELDRPIPAKTIETMVERRRRQMLIKRSEDIARTEGTRATSEAREESLDQMIEQTGISVDRVERIWNTTRDKRRRDWHATMDGQKRGRADPFIDGLGNKLRYPCDPAAPAETVINCRCGLTFSIKPAA